ncbi:MAG: Holliday junction branch migration protein RuvA [Candidatus Marinimicrobia bacterium]|nr:Holliday junction branch migration protein RuvA [Candidatus Neomarinimicrobiota bacterium]
MIEYISGKLISKNQSLAIIDVNGLGYRVNITNNTLEKLPSPENLVKLLIFFHVYENGQELYGFFDEKERFLFTKLITISGIGPKTAINMLSVLPPEEFRNRLISGEVKLLTSLPGIGPKTAKRIIIELKDDLGSSDSSELGIKETSKVNDASSALKNLGFSPILIREAVTKVLKDNKELSTEKIITESLRILK